MKISKTRVREYILYIMVFYVLNKNLWDWLLKGIFKNVYYGIVALGFLFCFIYLFKTHAYRTIVSSFAVYAFVIAFNGFILSNPAQRSVGIIEYITYPMAFFALVYFMKDYKNVNRLLNCMIAWSAVTSVLAIIEYAMKKSILPDFEGRIYTFDNGSSSYRSTVFIGSPMMLGVVLGVVLLIGVYNYNLTQKKVYRNVAMLDFLGLFCTGSRGPLICTVLGVVIMYYNYYQQNKLKRNTLAAIYLLAMFAIFFVLGLAAFPNLKTGNETIDFMIYRFSSAFNFQTEWGNVERSVRWEYYIKMFLNKPIFGYGIATTSAAVDTNKAVSVHGITTESGVLARLVETGLVGAVSYYLFLIKCMKIVFNKKIKKLSNEQIVIAGGIALVLVEDVILQISLDLFCTFIFFFIMAYGVVLVINREVSG